MVKQCPLTSGYMGKAHVFDPKNIFFLACMSCHEEIL